MKFLILLALFASVFLCNNAYADDPDLTELSEKENNDFYSMVPLFSDSEPVPPPFPGVEPYRRCIAIRCPIKCRICICRCIKFA